MGVNKALLTLDDGRSLIAHVVQHLHPLSKDLLLVTNTPELYNDLDIRHTRDHFVGKGPLAGLHAGLLAARCEWALAVACDMPLVDHGLVRYMTVLSPGYDAVVPRRDGALEPLHALYSKGCLPAIEKRLAADDLRLISFYADVRIRYVAAAEIAIFDPQGRSFSNANTPEDWRQLKQLVEAQRFAARSAAHDA